jgi:cation diffusion facilitator family transporter
LIPELLKPIDEHTAEADAEDDAARLPVRIAVHASLYGNIALCILQVYAAISSLSLSLISTGIDSVFDIGSNALLFYLHRQSIKMRKDENKWPVGGARLECIGNIIFGFLMAAVNLVVIVESVRAIVTKEGDDLHKFHLPSILAVAASLAVKLGLFLYSYGLRKKSSQVQILWEDHRNDLFLNGFAIITSTGGSKIVWWLDPAGAIVLGAFIIISWTRTIYGEFAQLAGRSAPHEFLQLLTYKAATFSEAIERVDTVRAYHSGPNYFVEVDIVMDGSSTLYSAHDLSQSLQDKLEALPGVERAFVHVDYETDHTPEHRKRKLA